MRYVLPLLLLLLATSVQAREPSREALLGDLLRARSDGEVDAALDALADRIGKSPGFEDHGAFGDWLAGVAKAQHPRVRLRRGWAYLGARRPADAIRTLADAQEDTAARPTALAYLGEAHRQNGNPERALELLRQAATSGYDDATFLDEAAHKAGFELRGVKPAREAEGLPAYAAPMDRYLAVRPTAALHAAVTRWMVDDHFAFAKDGRDRAKTWSAWAAKHLLAAVRLDAGVPGAALLALDAAWALRRDHPDPKARPLYFDCLAWSYRLGRGLDRDTHAVPQAIALLAEAAFEEARYPLAAKLARERLDISDSVLAREVLRRLPLDLGA